MVKDDEIFYKWQLPLPYENGRFLADDKCLMRNFVWPFSPKISLILCLPLLGLEISSGPGNSARTEWNQSLLYSSLPPARHLYLHPPHTSVRLSEHVGPLGGRGRDGRVGDDGRPQQTGHHLQWEDPGRVLLSPGMSWWQTDRQTDMRGRMVFSDVILSLCI